MKYQTWLLMFLGKYFPRKSWDVEEKLTKFLDNFITELYNTTVESATGKDSMKMQYSNVVLEMLEKKKKEFPLSEEELIKLQREIEDLTILFDEESIFKTAGNLVKMLIRSDDLNAKEYLRSHQSLSDEDSELLSELGKYTIEALIVHVLSLLFYSAGDKGLIKVATLIERMESSVRVHALITRQRRKKEDLSLPKDLPSNNEPIPSNKMKKKERKYDKEHPFGVGLVRFMIDRKLIELKEDVTSIKAVRRGSSYYLPTHQYVVCTFDVSLLPIRLNLPMVCKPRKWACYQSDKKARTVSDLSGGYLCEPTAEMYNRYRLLTSHDVNQFYIDISEGDNCSKLCEVMNKLQSEKFKINRCMLDIIYENYELLVEKGLIFPEFLSRVNNKEVSSLLRKYYLNDQVISKEYGFEDLLSSIYKIIQGSRYEQTMLRLCKALDGYDIYLPAYLDFRGRIYRSGILHFHERDLTRSLLLFSDVNTTDSNEEKQKAYDALAFHYKSFSTIDECREWSNKTINTITDMMIYNSDEEVTLNHFIELSAKAKNPFQFLSHALGLFMNKWGNLPIVQDASASAYQLMSYFLLNEKMAMITNLIPNRDGKINDIYTMLLEELLVFFDKVLSEPLLSTVIKLFNRSLVKSIYMPMIYGKSQYSVCTDLKSEFSNKLTDKECREITQICFRFWSDRYHGMDCLIKLIRSIGWVVSSRDSPVSYKVPFFRTVQDYMVMKPINVWVYDVNNKKRRRVTLRVTTDKRDRRKSEISTFVNFIHQKDAYIAMSVIEKMQIINAPVYTVHDNFISTATYCDLLPSIYSNVIREMGPPLLIINDFIYKNIIKPVLRCEGCEGIDYASYNEDYFRKNIIDKNQLKHFLERNIPTHIKKNKNAYNTWLDKNKVIVDTYDMYTREVCGNLNSSCELTPRNLMSLHQRAWDDFCSKLQNKERLQYYCVHY